MQDVSATVLTAATVASTVVPATTTVPVTAVSTTTIPPRAPPIATASTVPTTTAPTRVTTAASAAVRPFVRRVRARAEDPFPAMLTKILTSQEAFHSRATKYDKAVQIFQERFMFGLNARQEMGFIALLSKSKPMVDQFMSFSDAQRDIFVAEKKDSM